MIQINPPNGVAGAIVGILMATFFAVLIYKEIGGPSSAPPPSLPAPSRADSPPPITSRDFYYVDDTRPPDAYLALTTAPGDQGIRVLEMPNGTLLEVLEKRADGWWRVRVLSNGKEGWALNRYGNRVWIHCCRSQN